MRQVQPVTPCASVTGCGPRGVGVYVHNLFGISGHSDSAQGNAQEKGQLKATSSQQSFTGAREWGTCGRRGSGQAPDHSLCTSCTCDISKLFSHLGEHQSPLEGSFKHTLLGCTPECRIPQVWSGTRKPAFNKFPGGVQAAGLESKLGEPQL